MNIKKNDTFIIDQTENPSNPRMGIWVMMGVSQTAKTGNIFISRYEMWRRGSSVGLGSSQWMEAVELSRGSGLRTLPTNFSHM